MKLESSWQIFKKILKYQISWKSFQWDLRCSMWMERQTNMMKLIVLFFAILQTRQKIEFLSLFVIHSFHWHVQNVMIPCCSQELLLFVITELTIKFSQCFLIFTPHFQLKWTFLSPPTLKKPTNSCPRARHGLHLSGQNFHYLPLKFTDTQCKTHRNWILLKNELK